MSYVPPHLRNSVTKTVGSSADTAVTTLESNNSHCNSKVSCANGITDSQSALHRSSCNYITPRTLAAPDAIFPQWKPSERVINLLPEQVESMYPCVLTIF